MHFCRNHLHTCMYSKNIDQFEALSLYLSSNTVLIKGNIFMAHCLDGCTIKPSAFPDIFLKMRSISITNVFPHTLGAFPTPQIYYSGSSVNCEAWSASTGLSHLLVSFF